MPCRQSGGVSQPVSNDPFFIEKLRDVVGLYLSPPDNALVICVDEKSQCQALERTQPMLDRKLSQVLFRAIVSTVKLTVKRRGFSSKSRVEAAFQAFEMME